MTTATESEGNQLSAFAQQLIANPKDIIGSTKLPLDLIPITASAWASLAHLDGKLKYGAWNWRIAGIRASIYVAACARHINCWMHGEEFDPVSKVHHLGHAIACLNILIDAQAVGKLTDDRPPSFEIRKYLTELQIVLDGLHKQHAGKNPKHYTIADLIVSRDEKYGTGV